MKHSKHKSKTILLISILLVVIVIALSLNIVNKKVAIQETTRIYIPTNSTFADLTDTLESNNIVSKTKIFNILAQIRGLNKNVKSGSYVIKPNTSYIRLIQKLYTGNQDPILVTIGKYRTIQQLSTAVAKKMEFSDHDLTTILIDPNFCEIYNHTPQTIIGAFTPNTYEVYWNYSPKRFIERMIMETDAFWDDSRQSKLKAIGLTRNQVTTLASIVEEETNCNEEKATIASVYLNRLRRGMKLEADPTVKYAIGDFSIRRILNRHIETKSPYNTYLNKGLPPGPICTVSAESIDAVLADKHTDYLYFCAKEDFSGRHNFASTFAQHQANANRFHSALNSRKIYK